MDIHPRSLWYNPALCSETGGFFPPGEVATRTIVELEPWDLVRRDMLVLLLRSVIERRIEGDLAELGVWRGATARLIHHYIPERSLHLFDTFSGFDRRDIDTERSVTGVNAAATAFSDTSVEAVLRLIQPGNDNIATHVGYFPESIPADFGRRRFAFIHLDSDLYPPILAGLRYFYERMTPGGVIVVHDYNAWQGARRAVDEFFSGKRETPVPMPDKSGSAVIVKL